MVFVSDAADGRDCEAYRGKHLLVVICVRANNRPNQLKNNHDHAVHKGYVGKLQESYQRVLISAAATKA